MKNAGKIQEFLYSRKKRFCFLLQPWAKGRQEIDIGNFAQKEMMNLNQSFSMPKISKC
jgi:hypothetical protein